MRVSELKRDWVTSAGRVWSDLLRMSDANQVFMSWEWVSSWIELLEKDTQVRVLGVFNGECLVALIPLYVDRPATAIGGRRLSLNRVEQTGADFSDLLCVRGFEDAAIKAIADWLLKREDWVRCEFRDILPTALVRRLAGQFDDRVRVEDLAGSVRPRASLAGGWDRFLRERFDRKRRYNIERQIRLAGERHGLRLMLHDHAGEIARQMAGLVRLHNERKHLQGVSSAFSGAGSLGFHERAVAKLCDAGKAFIATLESDQEVASVAYCLRDAKSIYYFQTGMSANGATLGAGSTLLSMLIRWAAEEGFEWFDFLKGNEEYKGLWATEKVEQRFLRITRANLHGLAGQTLVRTRRELGRIYRQKLMRA